MKIVIQRVKYASVTIEGKVHGKIDGGIMALIGFKEGDEESLLKPMAEKMTGIHIGNIARNVRGECKTAGGYVWRRKKE